MDRAHARRAITRTLLLSVVALAALPAASANAGRLWVTGHDADFHCRGNQQCHYVQQAVQYVRGGAPDPNKPVLVLDRLDLDFVVALDNAFGAGAVPRVVLDPRSPEFASEPLTPERYSAILIASDFNCGGCDLNEADSTPDSDAINARKTAIEDFFNAGGGVYANAGASHGDGNPANGADVYYDFAPLPLGGEVVQPPFCLTPLGAELGLEDPNGCPDPSKRRGTSDDINCCPTHNSFTEPASDTAIGVAERDLGDDGTVSADDAPETLVAEGTIREGRIVPPSAPAASCSGDKQVPALTITSNQGKTLYRRGAKASVRITASDESGLRSDPSDASQAISTRTAGRKRLTVSATDRCGNRAERVFRYTVAAPPTARVAGFSTLGCTSRNFRATVRVTTRGASVSRVRVSVDGNVIRSTRDRSFSVRVPARRLRAGRHRLRVAVTDRAGNRSSRTVRFSRCRPIRITLTG